MTDIDTSGSCLPRPRNLRRRGMGMDENRKKYTKNDEEEKEEQAD